MKKHVIYGTIIVILAALVLREYGRYCDALAENDRLSHALQLAQTPIVDCSDYDPSVLKISLRGTK